MAWKAYCREAASGSRGSRSEAATVNDSKKARSASLNKLLPRGVSKARNPRFFGREGGAVDDLIQKNLELIFNGISQIKIKETVDREGVDSFINASAMLAATSGALAGAAGIVGVAAIPVDALNIITQHFRVVLAVIYSKTGKYNCTFSEALAIMGLSLGVHASARALTTVVARELGKKLATRSAAKLIPFAGAVLGSGANYTYIRSVGAALKKLELEG